MIQIKCYKFRFLQGTTEEKPFFGMDNSRCRLCLDGLQENNSVALKDFETNMLKALLPELDLGISIDPKICDKCIKLLVVCYEFKTTWLENNVKEKNVFTSNETSSVQLLCCLCREHIFEELGSEDLTEWKEMADKCVPELDIFSSKKHYLL
ncbi:hypothetical protein NQ317_008244 [Molorchus minor]|uniref:ZAD domain-containing protein n=1 Tax=Molorchus minor TaxID=1323400 RepID=A0ABQ9J1E4_9CUCU|nr:hypothetical protein NQ317_008244 [Molorchus minor]